MGGGVGIQELENALLYFILALISAGVGYFAGHGKQQLLTSVAYAPLFLIALFGFIQIFNADPAEAQQLAVPKLQMLPAGLLIIYPVLSLTMSQT